MKKFNNTFNLALALLFLVVVACVCPKPEDLKDSSSKDNSSSISDNTEKKSKNGVTMANYERVKTGMTYGEVVNIFGKEGESVSENEFGNLKTVMYKWDGDNLMSSTTIIFQNGKVTSKSQFNLK